MARALGGIIVRGVQVQLERAPLVVAVAEDLVADLPVDDADRLGVADAQEVEAVVRREGARRAQARPEADRAPIIARAVQTYQGRVGGVAIGIRYPRGRLFRLPASGTLQVGAIVDGDHDAGTGALGEADVAAEVGARREVPRVAVVPRC